MKVKGTYWLQAAIECTTTNATLIAMCLTPASHHANDHRAHPSNDPLRASRSRKPNELLHLSTPKHLPMPLYLERIEPIRANPLHPTFIDKTSKIKYNDCGKIISLREDNLIVGRKGNRPHLWANHEWSSISCHVSWSMPWSWFIHE
jgi:hypothetical protein